MKDPMIESQVAALKEAVDQVNVIMDNLQQLNVDVRISYVEKNPTKEISQGITIWRIEEHNDYL
jgi:hypothetical protein